MLASENPSSGEGRNMREKCLFFWSAHLRCNQQLRGKLIPAYEALLTQSRAMCAHNVYLFEKEKSVK